MFESILSYLWEALSATLIQILILLGPGLLLAIILNLIEPGKQLSMLNGTDQRLEKLNRAVDRIRTKYGFSAIQTGRTLWLKDIFPDSSTSIRKDRLLEGENARSVFPFLIVVITDKDKETSFAQGPRKESTIKST